LHQQISTGWRRFRPFFYLLQASTSGIHHILWIRFVRTFVFNFFLRIAFVATSLYPSSTGPVYDTIIRRVGPLKHITYQTFKMRTSFLAPFFCLAASSLAQGPPEGVAPDAGAPEGCQTTVEGKFMIGTLENPTLRRRETAQEVCSSSQLLHYRLQKDIGLWIASRLWRMNMLPVS
jgi:hypothetical protein